MIFARATSGDKQVFIIGLSRLNIEKLLNGDPIQICKRTHGQGVPEGWEILIMFGETELIMAQELRKNGALDETTKVSVDPRLGS